eukprot:6236892-Amphidinium_carterae.2
MKDISHIGVIGQYGGDGNADEEGMEQIHVTDFGNKVYATVIRDGTLPEFTELSADFSEENKGDVLETLMGLNFLEKDHRLTLSRLKNGAITVVPTTQVPWWTGCEFPITCDSELTQQWKVMNDLIAGQMMQYKDAVQNSQQADCNMPSIYRRLREGMDARIEKIATQPNYGRGIPVLVSGYELSPITLELLGFKARSVEIEEVHRHNMAVLQELDNPELTKQYNNHMATTTKFLAVITEKEDGVVGVLASTPAQEPQIIEQTRRRVGVTLTPGPAVSSKEFADVDLVLVDQAATRQPVPDIVLDEKTIMSTLRVRGIAVESPLKIKKKSGIRSLYSGSPDEVGDAQESAIRYPTRECSLVPSSQSFSQVTLHALVAEGVDVENNAMERVEGMWILNGYVMKGDDNQMERHLKILV